MTRAGVVNTGKEELVQPLSGSELYGEGCIRFTRTRATRYDQGLDARLQHSPLCLKSPLGQTVSTHGKMGCAQ